MSKIYLHDWKVAGFWPYTPILNRSMETGLNLKGVTPWIDTTVPGSIYKSLQQNGLIDDPYVDMNSIKCEWVSNRWWVYKTTFVTDSSYDKKRIQLIFKGIDYKAHIYLNAEKLSVHIGMYTPEIIDITDKIKYNTLNEITVIFEHAPDEMGQIGYTSLTNTQKSRFNYKWDFSTRLVNIGLYDEVYLKITDSAYFDESYIKSEINTFMGFSLKQTICNKADFMDVSVFDEGNNLVFTDIKALPTNEIEFKIPFENAELWYPNGYGKPYLYRIEKKLYINEVLSDEETVYSGIRSLSYCQNENAPLDSLPYTIVINTKPIHIKGVNMTPLDLQYGSVGKPEYKHYIELMKDANINLVRVWGGGMIEKEEFYDLCDHNGIMVWQEFIQSSSGIDNIPSELPSFYELLEKTAVYAVKTRRNHVSLTIWSGGNELMEADGRPVNYENANIKKLKAIVDKYDPLRLMLPTSASGPLEFLQPEKKGLNHDVHGPWKYGGTKWHYELYNNSDSLLHSEFGCDGLTNLHSMKRFLSPDNIGVFDMSNIVWRFKGEWWDTLQRDQEIFGDIKTIDDFILLSQFMQAEGLRYPLEANRRRAFRNCGSIIWQFNEPYPNVSCTSLIDYTGAPKFAYYYVKKAYEALHVSMQYDKLVFNNDDTFNGIIYIHSDVKPFDGEVKMTFKNDSNIILKEETFKANAETHPQKVSEISFTLEQTEDIFFVSLEILNTDIINEYVFIKNKGDNKKSIQEKILSYLKDTKN